MTLDSLELARLIVDVVEEHKADNIVLLDLRPHTIIADFFVLCNGNSPRQIKALMEYVHESVKEKTGQNAFSTEGTAESGWVLMDYGTVIVHIFHEEQRHYYKLEELWSGVGQVLVSIQ